MNTPAPPDALLFIAPGCPHCPGVLQALAELVKQGLLGRLEVVNVAAHPERAAAEGVRSAPWTRIGEVELEGGQDAAALRRWAQLASSDAGISAYLVELLRTGRLAKAETLLLRQPSRLALLPPLLVDTAAPLQVRMGLAALLEGFAGTPALQALVPALAALSTHADHRVRADACHALGLSGSPLARPHLQHCLGDDHPEVREIAAEALEILGD